MFTWALASLVGLTNQCVVKGMPFDVLAEQVIELAKHGDAVNHKEFFATWLRLLAIERESGEFATALEAFKTQLALVGKTITPDTQNPDTPNLDTPNLDTPNPDTPLAIAFKQLKW